MHGNARAVPRAQTDIGAPARGGRDVGGGKGAGVTGGQGPSASSAAAALKVGGDIESISDSEEEDMEKEEELFAGNILGKRPGASADLRAAARPRY